MERIWGLFARTYSKKDLPAEYEPLRTSGDDEPRDEVPEVSRESAAQVPFSWFEYTIFALVGVAMLWAW